MYADRETEAMRRAIQETNRRRERQEAYNVEHNITPATVTKAILDLSPTSGGRDYYAVPKGRNAANAKGPIDSATDAAERLEALRQEMFAAAEALEFEKAARLRDQIRLLKGEMSDEDVQAAAQARSGGKPSRGPAKNGKATGRGNGGGAGPKRSPSPSSSPSRSAGGSRGRAR
jgi:excinuclease ABC subunit B